MERSHRPSARWFDYDAAAILGVAGEAYIAARCTRHVISPASGLGLQAFFGSAEVAVERARLLPNCTSARSLADLAGSWSAI